ncbi:MAG: GNAT family N-acetyltransferase [Ktedonobacteraceae bacterium]|nr:GNAT family N-acetyltransferase [Ktedonobacteraceae bacterium]
MATFRSARESDLPEIYYIFYLNETAYASAPRPKRGEVAADFRHIHKTGTMYVADDHGRILGFAASITRADKTFLTHLYVHPDHQSEHLGTQLLQFVLPTDKEQTRFTVSSTDLRALSLYIRLGMQPQWPNYLLGAFGSPTISSLQTEIECQEGVTDDPQFAEWDSMASGRRRPEDIAYWVSEQQAIPLWFRRRDKTVGYAYVSFNTSSFWASDVCTIGPLGVKRAEDAADCVLAAVRWASQHKARAYRIDVPGPHPCLAPLLAAGFRIFYNETFVSSAHTPFFDPRCYIPSGSNLF